MSTSHGGGRKRKKGDRVFQFRSFCQPGHPTNFDGSSFQQNMQNLLQFGHVEIDSSTGLKTWSFRLELCHHPALHVSLFIVEEPVEESVYLHCHHCRCVGWGPHMICSRKYHLVLPSNETRKKMNCCGHGGGSSMGFTLKQNLLELEGHSMHGVFHSNGFGHLLCINGFEICSEFTGSQIMELWDRICSGLRARKVSLTDTAKKRSMELRLIHGLAYGEHWFGRWGYRFERGTYGVTLQMHQRAIETLRTIPMSMIIHQFCTCPDILSIFSRYQAMSGYTLQTLGHLYLFMLELKIRLPLESPAATRNHGVSSGNTACRWSSKRVEMATRVIIESLKKAKPRWVSRQEVRDSARVSIGDTGLLDFVLKSLSNHVVGKYMIRRTPNPVTKVLEYCLEDISKLFPSQVGSSSLNNARTKSTYYINRAQLLKDFFYLYKYLLRGNKQGLNDGMITGIPAAVRIVLDGKHLAKDYRAHSPRQSGIVTDEKLKLLCTIWLINQEEWTRRKLMPPYELIVIPVHATIKELKKEVEKSFREIYWYLRTFVAESIVEMNGEDTDLVYGLVESGSSVVVAGRITEKAKDEEVMYEGGDDNWVVDCHCGAKDDDGEQMISCYICEVWQHIRCVRVTEDVSQIYICIRCESSILAFPSLL
ncbi:PHD finger protein PERSISTENT TAPETAL CELL 1 [Aristolochia californica]|uniref:PHD finger protein PERSISTENT TAPETAL CELL 1 n=1 Tax=Aristolochia californica TaxID=171875 RepID=UPI0035D82FD4